MIVYCNQTKFLSFQENKKHFLLNLNIFYHSFLSLHLVNIASVELSWVPLRIFKTKVQFFTLSFRNFHDCVFERANEHTWMCAGNSSVNCSSKIFPFASSLRILITCLSIRSKMKYSKINGMKIWVPFVLQLRWNEPNSAGAELSSVLHIMVHQKWRTDCLSVTSIFFTLNYKCSFSAFCCSFLIVASLPSRLEKCWLSFVCLIQIPNEIIIDPWQSNYETLLHHHRRHRTSIIAFVVDKETKWLKYYLRRMKYTIPYMW